MYAVEKISALKSINIPESTLNILALSRVTREAEVRQAIAWSPSASNTTLEILRKDSREEVRYAAEHERSLPVEWRFKS